MWVRKESLILLIKAINMINDLKNASKQIIKSKLSDSGW